MYFVNTEKEEYEKSDNVDLEDYVDNDEEGIMEDSKNAGIILLVAFVTGSGFFVSKGATCQNSSERDFEWYTKVLSVVYCRVFETVVKIMTLSVYYVSIVSGNSHDTRSCLIKKIIRNLRLMTS